MRRLGILLACTLLAVACTGGQVGKVRALGPALQINGVEIYNALSYSVQDVSILAPETGEFVSCGEILPASSCSTSFPARDYRENPVVVSWKEHGQAHSTAEFKLDAPVSASDGQSAYIRVEVFEAGQAGATLVLQKPHSR